MPKAPPQSMGGSDPLLLEEAFKILDMMELFLIYAGANKGRSCLPTPWLITFSAGRFCSLNRRI